MKRLIGVGLLAMGLATGAQAQECNYMDAAAHWSGVPAIGDCPTLSVETVAWFNENAGPHVLGIVFVADPNTIHLRAGMFAGLKPEVGKLLLASVVLHEAVHVLQYRHGLSPTSHLACVAMELQAYVAQKKFLDNWGLNMTVPDNLGC